MKIATLLTIWAYTPPALATILLAIWLAFGTPAFLLSLAACVVSAIAFMLFTAWAWRRMDRMGLE